MSALTSESSPDSVCEGTPYEKAVGIVGGSQSEAGSLPQAPIV